MTTRQRGEQLLIPSVNVGREIDCSVLVCDRRPIKDVDRQRLVKRKALRFPGLNRGVDFVQPRIWIACQGKGAKRTDLLHANAAVTQMPLIAREQRGGRGKCNYS